MQDLFEYPTLTSTQPEEQVKELVNYLVQFKETLEFALGNISADNLSTDLISKLNTLGADIKKSSEVVEEQIQQIVKQGLTVSDVLNSEEYKASIKAVEDQIPTQYLESVDDVLNSEEYKASLKTVSDQIPTQYVESVDDVLNSEEYKASLKAVSDQIPTQYVESVDEVLNSDAYKASIKTVSDKIPTKYLESVEQIQTSEEAGGINIYAFTDASGTKQEFTVRNGKTPTLKLSVNYETGNLEYTAT